MTVDKGYRKYGKDALKKIIKEDFKRAWVESSGQSEKLMMSLGGEKYMIPNTKIKEIMGDENEKKIYEKNIYKTIRKDIIGTHVVAERNRWIKSRLVWSKLV